MVWDATNFIFWVSGRSGGQEYKGMGLRSTGLLYPGRDWFLGFGFFSPPPVARFLSQEVVRGRITYDSSQQQKRGLVRGDEEKFEICSFFFSCFFQAHVLFHEFFFSRLFFFFPFFSDFISLHFGAHCG